MLKMLRNKKGQGLVEYGLLLAIIVGIALLIGGGTLRTKAGSVYDKAGTKATEAVDSLSNP